MDLELLRTGYEELTDPALSQIQDPGLARPQPCNIGNTVSDSKGDWKLIKREGAV